MTTTAPSIGDHETAVTREGYERLREELTALTTTSRAEIGERLRDARAQGGELADNLELLDALEDQEFLERRIATLETALVSAMVVDDPPNDGTIGVGTRVRLRDADTGRAMEYDFVGSIEADPGRRRVSAESPVGRALLGRRAGDMVDVKAPGGRMHFEVLEVHGGARAARRPRAYVDRSTGARRAALASPG
jgi:transcription elongation factor GreA